MTNENRDKELEFTLKFIENVKSGEFTDITPDIEDVLSRIDQPTVYAEDIDCEPLHSFSN